ncbi:histidinol dehydrogenase [Salinibacillus xinjiangensis]|uniref:Histidinol dehydrogenase n=1 Tax=Salinibacillus xinjiangensis TaxID=1229268 RepID=A0A6G1X940_9BACI|nr:histidinol dehydrogenase [Salinibacillus xinjiangensis]MRG87457.1 histidinol dehydrogenase [Salinibacillus xinjiangensis]
MLKVVKDQVRITRTILDDNDDQYEAVKTILKDVKENKDEALFRYTEKFDQVQLEQLRVAKSEIIEAYGQAETSFVGAIKTAIENIRDFHEKQKRQSWMDTKPSGTILGQLIRPLSMVGIYVPGGSAAYPSSVLMNAIPAQVAGVEEIVMVTPPNAEGKVNPGVLIAANELGLKQIYKIGGAQAIGALAYGTESIPKVDKITGPGNIFVALAKKEVFGLVDIDMVAGPSEILVLADESAQPHLVAADLLSQAEHDPMSSAILVTTSNEIAMQVKSEIAKQLQNLPRKEIAEQSIRNQGTAYIVPDVDTGIQMVNDFAPEHLEVIVEDPFSHVGKIKNAGAIFLGENSTEAIGDYFAGPNHVLPTGGTAKFSSPLNVDDFMKKSSLISYSQTDLQNNADAITTLAQFEQLQGHANAIIFRKQNES